MAGNLLAAEENWLTSVPEAQAQAQAEKKLILLDFTGSDWCVPCKKLDQEVFSTPEFQAYARSNLVLVKVDFPLSKPQPEQLKAANQALQEKYNIAGYPTLVLIKPDGKVVYEQEALPKGGAAEVIAKLDEARKK